MKSLDKKAGERLFLAFILLVLAVVVLRTFGFNGLPSFAVIGLHGCLLLVGLASVTIGILGWLFGQKSWPANWMKSGGIITAVTVAAFYGEAQNFLHGILH